MDAVGFGKAVLFGMSEGGPAAIAFAATRPERTRALILTGTIAYRLHRLGRLRRDPAELRARLCPSWVRTTRRRRSSSPAARKWAAPPARRGAAARHSRSVLPSVRSIASSQCWSACAPARGWRGRRSKRVRIDVRPILPTITVPTLVVHAREDRHSGAERPVPRRPHPRRPVCSRSTARTTGPGSPSPTGS